MQKTLAVLPPEFLQRLHQIYDTPTGETILQSFTTEKPVTIRVNTLKAPADKVEAELKAFGIGYTRVSWYPDAFIIDKPSREVTKLPLYTEGKIYIQSLSSMIPAIVLAPSPNEKILDMAAAPGSKTTQIGAFMNNTGEVLANDMSRERIYKLTSNLAHYSVTNTRVSNIPGQALWQKYPEYFDRVLVDVPCSMEGRFRSNDPKSFEDWSVKKIKKLAKIQKWLLRSAISATAVYGTIVYSTCTLAPEENEEVIDWILKKEAKTIQLEEVIIQGLEMKNGLTSFEGTDFSPELSKTKRIIPSEKMEGFFIAKIKKIQSNVNNFIA